MEQKVKRRKVAPLVMFMVMALVMLFSGYFWGFHDAIGEYPSPFKRTVLPPDLSPASQTFDQVVEFIRNDTTDKLEYEEGFNCVDFVFMVVRHAHWNSVVAEPIRVVFDDSSEHMLLMVPTSDRGTVFFETMTDKQVEPKVGRLYMRKMVTGLYGLANAWVPLDEYRRAIGW